MGTRRGYASSNSEGTASDEEGGPGVFIGGHTGHAAAELAAARSANEARERAAEEARLRHVAERLELQAQLDARMGGAGANPANGEGDLAIGMGGDVDLDADIEDLDD